MTISWLLCISKSKVPPNHKLLAALPKMIGSVLDMNRILDFLNAVNVCIGNDDDKYQELVKARKGNFMDPSGLLISINLSLLMYFQVITELPFMMISEVQFSVKTVN